MALRFWAPLIGDLYNQGLDGVQLSNPTPDWTNDGKIGKAFISNGKSASVTVPSLNASVATTIGSAEQSGEIRRFTFSFWARILNTNTHSNYSTTISLSLYTKSKSDYGSVESNSSFWLLRGTNSSTNSSSGLYWVYYNQSNIVYNSGTGSHDDKWHHYTITCDGEYFRYYRDGSVTTSYKLSSYLSQYRLKGTISIGNNNSQAYLNDVRIYDHCLTPQEVKEISKGLVAHYTLGSACAEAPALRSRLSSATWNLLCKDNLSHSGFTITKTGTTYNFVCNNFPLYSGIVLSNVTPIENHKYYVEINIRQNSLKKLYFNSNPNNCSVGALNIPANGTGLYKGVITKTYMSGELTWALQNVDALTSGSILFDSPKIVDLTVLFGAGNEPTADSFCKAFPGYYPYDSGTTKDLRLPIPDSSGYSRNLTITGNVSQADSVRYDKSLKFNGSSYLSCTSPTAEAKTLSLWAYIGSAIPTSSQVLFADYKSKLGLGFYNSGTLIITRCSGTNATTGAVTLVKLNSWNHFCVVNGSSNILYINGTAASMSGSNEWTHNTDTLMVGRRSEGTGFTDKISDVRLYATALSADDVKDLYNLGALIS